MSRLDYSSRAVATAIGGVLTSSCTSPVSSESSTRLPVLVSVVVANDTNRNHEYEVRVQFALEAERPLETVFQTEGTLQARNRQEVNENWPQDPGQYAISIAVDGGEWQTQNVTDRLTQSEQICYRQELSISGDGVTFAVNINADCSN